MGQQPVIQTSFNSGEWAPALYGRVDLAKYHSGAALLRNFFVDYRGGATARAGTRYILQAKGGGTGQVRLIPFQASFSVAYVLEFGNNYIRFYNAGSPVLEATKNITAATNANPGLITSVAHGYSTGDWVYIAGVGGMTQLNGNYYILNVTNVNVYSLTDLNGVAINTTAFGVYTSGGTTRRVYTLATTYLASELAAIKFSQSVNQMVICHPNHQPALLTLVTSASWSLASITFGSTAVAPVSLAYGSSFAAGTVHNSYVVTSVDINGQESGPSAVLDSGGITPATPGSAQISWAAAANAVSYNVYKTAFSVLGALPVGSQFGFIGNCTGIIFTDPQFLADFSQGPPRPQNPFSGSGVQSISLTANGTGYTSVPSVTLTAAPGGGQTATAYCNLEALSATVAVGQSFPTLSYIVGDFLYGPNGTIFVVAAIDGTGGVTSVTVVNRGLVVSGAIPSNPVATTTPSAFGNGCTLNITWRVSAVYLSSSGTSYLIAPSVTFGTGFGGSGATATTALGAASSGNPTVPGFYQQRLVLAGPISNVQQFNGSQPGYYFNFDTSFPLQPNDAFQSSLVSGKLNTIQAMVSMPSGLVFLADQQAWLVNGGSAGSAFSATNIVANPQAYNGMASNPPPIVAGYDILYVQAKGSIVRDLSYNFYSNVYTGTDISVLSSHLFYGFQVLEWAWAEEPFKVAWGVRNDGTALSLTFLKEQELIAWSHSDTNGLFKSVASVVETVAQGAIDAVYWVVQRTVNGSTVQYIERMAELYFPNGAQDAWCVDAGIGYNGTATISFTGAQHLAGMSVTGVADGIVIPTFTMPTNGSFTLTTAASVVTIGLAYTPELQTLPLDLGEPTVQGKRKKITGVDIKVRETLGLWIGCEEDTIVAMKDLVVGNVGSQSNEVVTGLFTGDARTIIDPRWDVEGQYFITQPSPLPASILAVVPEIAVGDTSK